jgi:hypothetical protein
MQKWPEKRLQRLFQRYNQKFWNGRLAGWMVQDSPDIPSIYGYCSSSKTKRIYVRVEAHKSDRHVRATLIHEMAHAATYRGHGGRWLLEMQRLKRAGAPTIALDFLKMPSGKVRRRIVALFMEYAEAGLSWDEAMNELRDSIPFRRGTAEFLRTCKKFFNLAKREGKFEGMPDGA